MPPGRGGGVNASFAAAAAADGIPFEPRSFDWLCEQGHVGLERVVATPAMGHPPVVRIAAPEGDGAATYARHRDALQRRMVP